MNARVKPQWAEYEALAHKIFQELLPYAEVTLDEHVLGVHTEARRQIDVTARWRESSGEHHLMIVQVKDYKRRADVNVVGEFVSVIDDVRADKGVLICSGGFSKTAVTYARNKGIQLYSLADATSKDWTAELTIPVVWNQLTPLVRFTGRVYLDAGWSVLTEPGAQIPQLSRDGGISRINVISEFAVAWNSGSLEMSVAIEYGFPLGGELFMLVEDERGHEIWRPIRITMKYTVRSESLLAHLQPEEYRGLLDHLDDKNFVPSYLGVEIPPLTDASWSKIRDPDAVAPKRGCLFITAENPQIDVSPSQWEPLSFTYLGPHDPDD